MTKALTLDEARDAVAAALAGAGPFWGYQTARRIEDLARAIARQEIAALSGRARSRAEDARVGPVTWRGDPPDRIRVEQDIDGFWTCRKAVSGSPEFIRVDLYEAALRSRNATIAGLEHQLSEAVQDHEDDKAHIAHADAYRKAQEEAERERDDLRAQLDEKDRRIGALEEVLRAAPRPCVHPESLIDPVVYMDWYFAPRGRALSPDKEASS